MEKLSFVLSQWEIGRALENLVCADALCSSFTISLFSVEELEAQVDHLVRPWGDGGSFRVGWSVSRTLPFHSSAEGDKWNEDSWQ